MRERFGSALTDSPRTALMSYWYFSIMPKVSSMTSHSNSRMFNAMNADAKSSVSDTRACAKHQYARVSGRARETN